MSVKIHTNYTLNICVNIFQNIQIGWPGVTDLLKSPWMKHVELKDFTVETWNVESLYRAGNLT